VFVCFVHTDVNNVIILANDIICEFFFKKSERLLFLAPVRTHMVLLYALSRRMHGLQVFFC